MLGVYCGLSENIIDECSYIYFNDCIKELGIKLNYDAIVNLFGNSNMENPSEEVQKYNPFNMSITQNDTQHKNKTTLEDLKRMGINIKVDKNAKLINPSITNNKLK